MAWFAYQSLQSSNKSVEISNKALELTQRSIAASDIAAARSDSMTAHSLELADKTSKANIELAQLTKKNLELNRKSINAELKRNNDLRIQKLWENEPYIDLADQLLELSPENKVTIRFAFKSLNVPIIKAFISGGIISIVDANELSKIKKEKFDGDNEYRSLFNRLLHHDGIDTTKSEPSKSLYEIEDPKLTISNTRTLVIHYDSYETLDSSKFYSILDGESFVFCTYFINYFNYLTNNVREFRVAFYYEMEYINEEVRYKPHARMLYEDNLERSKNGKELISNF
ncbi:MAG: hypothetical protein IPH96_17425 [Saprospiraceae bacterium]|nr:hypothetical protein [Saprospiraceae bacterium]